VSHPQIAAFARLAKENTPPTRTLIGQKTLISRTMHAFDYDAVHDEIVVNSPLAQAVLIFRGGATEKNRPSATFKDLIRKLSAPVMARSMR